MTEFEFFLFFSLSHFPPSFSFFMYRVSVCAADFLGVCVSLELREKQAGWSRGGAKSNVGGVGLEWIAGSHGKAGETSSID